MCICLFIYLITKRVNIHDMPENFCHIPEDTLTAIDFVKKTSCCTLGIYLVLNYYRVKVISCIVGVKCIHDRRVTGATDSYAKFKYRRHLLTRGVWLLKMCWYNVLNCESIAWRFHGIRLCTGYLYYFSYIDLSHQLHLIYMFLHVYYIKATPKRNLV